MWDVFRKSLEIGGGEDLNRTAARFYLASYSGVIGIMEGDLNEGAQSSRQHLAALALRTVQAVADQVRRTRAEPPPAAPRGAGPDEKKPFTGKGLVWLEEAKGFEPLMEF